MRRASLVALVLLGGCFSSASDQTIEAPPSLQSSPSPSSPSSPSRLPPSASAAPGTKPQSGAIVLRPGGIDALSFGAPADQVVAAMTTSLGSVQQENRSAGCDSGADRTVRWAGLSAVFSGGKWVGYLWDGAASSPPAATDKGIKIGSTVAELKAAYPGVSVEDTTLGHEWFVEIDDTTSIGGFVSGPAATGKVQRIYSGDICAFR
jgi:hypothetical protein